MASAASRALTLYDYALDPKYGMARGVTRFIESLHLFKLDFLGFEQCLIPKYDIPMATLQQYIPSLESVLAMMQLDLRRDTFTITHPNTAFWCVVGMIIGTLACLHFVYRYVKYSHSDPRNIMIYLMFSYGNYASMCASGLMAHCLTPLKHPIRLVYGTIDECSTASSGLFLTIAIYQMLYRRGYEPFLLSFCVMVISGTCISGYYMDTPMLGHQCYFNLGIVPIISLSVYAALYRPFWKYSKRSRNRSRRKIWILKKITFTPLLIAIAMAPFCLFHPYICETMKWYDWTVLSTSFVFSNFGMLLEYLFILQYCNLVHTSPHKKNL